MTEDSRDTLLLDVMQTVGKIAGQNELILQEQGNASRDRKEQQQALHSIRDDLSAVKTAAASVASRVTAMEPDVGKMKAFRAQLAVAVVIVTSAVTGAINLIWLALSNMGQIKDAIREFLK